MTEDEGVLIEANQEKEFDYMNEALVTASNAFHGERIPLGYLQSVLNNCTEALKRLDEVKKAIFYNRAMPDFILEHLANHSIQPNCNAIPQSIDAENQQRGEVIFHAIVGKATEAGEQLELLARVIAGAPFDEVNYLEEVGDGFWYDAIGLKAINSNFNEAQRINIAKLRNRFPDKFNEYDANNRDLFAERQVLEGVDNAS